MIDNLAQKLDQNLVDLAWSLWTELGVPGVFNKHTNCAIDPEALLAFTAVLVNSDPRLKELVDIWYKIYKRYISTSRLRALQKILRYGMSSDDEGAEQAPIRKPATGHRSPSTPKHVVIAFDRPSTLLVRSRAVFGASARADVLAHLAFKPDYGTTSSQLAKRISLTKLSVAHVLDDLHAGRACTVEKERNTNVYRLVRAQEINNLLAPWPDMNPHWSTIFRFLLDCKELVDFSESHTPRAAAIRANKLLTLWKNFLQRAAVSFPSPEGDLPTYWNTVSIWCIDVSAKLAQGISPLLHTL